MSTTVSPERGAMLLESLISATLLLLTVVTVITFMHRALKGAQIQHHLLEPLCERPLCARNGTGATCTCGTQTYLILH